MKAIPRAVDDSSKRWIAVLVVSAVASIGFVGYSFVKTLSPQSPSVVAPEKPAPAPAEETVARAEPDWGGAAGTHGAESVQASTGRPDPFAAQEAAAAKAAIANDPVANQQAVHRESDYLRNLISQGKLPKAYGNLTKEKVDQMEKDGVMIE